MCGIVGYIGPRDAVPILLNGLRRLEYRGYDSAGIAVYTGPGEIQIRRNVGKLQGLVEAVEREPISGSPGIGHTRWATHGEPTVYNAHPHRSQSGRIVVVHNGIVENFLELKAELVAEGFTFRSETDTEVIVHLIERYLEGENLSLFEATRRALRHLKGSNAVVVMAAPEPDKLVTARLGNAGGITIGYGQGEMFIASDLPALLDHTREVAFLEPGQMAVVTRDGARLYTLDGEPVDFQVTTVPWDPVAAEKGEYRHFMLKEIHEQVRGLTDTIAGRVDVEQGRVRFLHLDISPQQARGIRKIFITACGTAYHAGLVGKTLLERLARIPVEVMVASEFRYADPLIGPDDVVLAISQSGETADTLAAMEEGRRKGATLWAIVNVIGSQAMRMADGYISMQVGPEISVASTKAYTAPLVDLYMLGLLLGELRGTLSAEQRRRLVDDLMHLPELVSEVLRREDDYAAVARQYVPIRNIFYLGRGIHMATAYEGALKLKEISYIHAEGYPAGEMKHGPIALLEPDFPVLALVPQDPWYEKMLSQVEQAKSRGAPVIALATDGDERVAELADHVLYIPPTPWLLAPVTAVVPLQIFAYVIATERGLDVDQPRNLAKSVTVE
ncbi:MAG: glutamine--fructose-6-phosphate transaminase (isomerizing) [Chloroflexi bacterium]|nr:glutamine--fructose-6-phosphate transaminase (isomerizing) [Chloroflexota bacterium]